jgi:DNA-nicking Smr family endonuclease
MSARKPDRLDDDEDHVLWQRVTALVKPAAQQNRRYSGTNHYHKNNQSGGLAAAKLSSKRQKALSKSGQAGVAATPAVPKTSSKTMPKASPVDLRAGETAGIDGGTQKRLFRGDVTIDARLDLHGFNATQAQRKLTQFLGQARLSGYRCILVITGKGARGEGVLRSSVPDWLKRPPLSDLVLAIAQAKPRDGGAGALYVLLRRQRDQK